MLSFCLSLRLQTFYTSDATSVSTEIQKAETGVQITTLSDLLLGPIRDTVKTHLENGIHISLQTEPCNTCISKVSDKL